MIEKITVRVFLVCLVSCASMVLFAIWVGKDAKLGETYFKTTASLFVVGLASFLSWLVCVSYKLHRSLKH